MLCGGNLIIHKYTLQTYYRKSPKMVFLHSESPPHVQFSETIKYAFA